MARGPRCGWRDEWEGRGPSRLVIITSDELRASERERDRHGDGGRHFHRAAARLPLLISR